MAVLSGEQELRQKYEEICKTNPEEYALVSWKIKRFRVFNRLFGREAGDRLIDSVGRAMAGKLKDGEYMAHIHLDYFNLLVYMPRDYDEIFQWVIDFNRSIRDREEDDGLGPAYSGIGIYLLEKEPVDFYRAQYNADIVRAESLESAFRDSHYEVYGMTRQDRNLRYYDMEQEIRPAMDRGDFRLYLQPKVDLRTGEVREAEALVRWIDPEKGMIPVSEFLPALEENGLIEELDIHLFGLVCQAVARWEKEYHRKIKISVNLNRCAFNYRYFFEYYVKEYEKHPCPKDCIGFELLESIILNQVEQVKRVVNEITGFGFECAVDDFGSGYSSFSVLTNSKISTMKIDRSLFLNDGDEREKTLVRHIIQTAQELRMKTVAEGVESRKYVKFLKDLGCDFIQGFVFYKPMPLEEFEKRFLMEGEKADLSFLE